VNPASCGISDPTGVAARDLNGDGDQTDSVVTLRDRDTGIARRVRPADIAVVFRSRDSHREYEAALDRRGVPTYVYKGLGFFEADEIQDAISLLRFLASPTSNLRAAAFLRSRIVRLSEAAVIELRTNLAGALVDAERPPEMERLDAEDRAVLERVRAAIPGWLATVDRVTPSELLDGILRETAYAYEIRGPRRAQARENLKKLRALIRKVENRGYATLAPAERFDGEPRIEIEGPLHRDAPKDADDAAEDALVHLRSEPLTERVGACERLLHLGRAVSARRELHGSERGEELHLHTPALERIREPRQHLEGVLELLRRLGVRCSA
jgi:superfamily I DNA/RNA helicase